MDDQYSLKIRRMATHVENIFSEKHIEADEPLRKVGVVAVVNNPFAGRFEPDLSRLVDQSAAIGASMFRALKDAMDDFQIESYGKGAVVGLNGEQEHGVAMITTVFGNAFRESVGGGKAWISSYTKRAGPSSTIDIPLAHKDALYVRSHYDGMTLYLADAPLPDEIAVICCVASRGRLNERVGGLRKEEIRGENGLN